MVIALLVDIIYPYAAAIGLNLIPPLGVVSRLGRRGFKSPDFNNETGARASRFTTLTIPGQTPPFSAQALQWF
jgi:hypothetical protein